ncbi:MAG: hypothetical protein GY926_27360 [bacterium]|nr:hypothetical protein [bacterium]
MLIAVLVSTVLMARDERHAPQADRGYGCIIIPLLYVFMGGMGWLLWIATNSESQGGVLTTAIVLAYPVLMMVAIPTVKGYERWRFEREYARVGSFKDPALRPFAAAILAGDADVLASLLDGKPAPEGLDRAEHDMLGYALEAFRSRRGSLDCVRVMLEAGTDLNTASLPDGRAPIHFMITNTTAGGREAVHLLLKYGADPNVPDPVTGNTPINGAGDSVELVRALLEAGADMDRIQANGVTALVEYVARRDWEAAQFLVERGARLDVANEDGLSLDYYLKDWKKSVYGEHLEGWDRLREAIAARGKELP